MRDWPGLIRLEAVAVRRNGVGTPVVTAPPGIDAAIGSAGLKPYLDFAKGYRAGNTAGGALPNGATMQLLGVMGQRVDPRPAIEYHDRAIGLVALQHFLNLDDHGGFLL
ncbi:phage portal protein family protein, partial [Mycobacteroides abscessus]|uniref:phage portal protein family protein n=1 Tax=Mycobacteroides abscessus TaxID=36809 RepID=UPI003CEE0EF0